MTYLLVLMYVDRIKHIFLMSGSVILMKPWSQYQGLERTPWRVRYPIDHAAVSVGAAEQCRGRSTVYLGLVSR